MIRNLNDGTSRAPYLRTDLNIGTLSDLPEWSAAPRGDAATLSHAIKAAGYQGIQGGDPAVCRSLGLGVTGGGRVNAVGDAEKIATELKAKGFECATLHVGWGMDSDADVDAMVTDIISVSERHDFPLYIETHRATITQDIWRTVELTRRIPEVRFNGDYSHWYTGLEMVYGPWEEKLAFLQPVFDRVRFLHGRIGNPGCMQVDIGDGVGRTYVEHFKEMWTRSMVGFLRSAGSGDFISFNPELLQPSIYYARVFPNQNGELVEECDRWTQALLYTEIAKVCFEEAQRRV